VQIEVEAGGRTRLVTVARTGDGFAVTVDDRSYHVDAAPVGAGSLSLVVDRGVASRPHASYLVTLAPGSNGSLVAMVGAVPVAVTVNGRRGSRASAGGGPSGPQSVKAPMPGRIARVLVQPGDRVRARQPVVVVEAMKMENELRAAHDGTVADVRAREGALVESGAVLVVIE
jgi:biotin carboxyl carrier protein